MGADTLLNVHLALLEMGHSVYTCDFYHFLSFPTRSSDASWIVLYAMKSIFLVQSVSLVAAYRILIIDRRNSAEVFNNIWETPMIKRLI